MRSYLAPGTFEVVQCSYQTDHIVVEKGGSDYNALVRTGKYDCSLHLGYFYRVGSGPSASLTPWSSKCKMWRFSHTISGKYGSHLFTTYDNVTGMTCEGVRAEVYSNHTCFYGKPSGC